MELQVFPPEKKIAKKTMQSYPRPMPQVLLELLQQYVVKNKMGSTMLGYHLQLRNHRGQSETFRPEKRYK